jgi:uncharacterized protein YbcC (UPF0753/DUF2309 family)
MKTLNELKAERLTAIKNRDNEALSKINAKIYAIREQARKEREAERQRQQDERIASKFNTLLEGGLLC